MKKYLFIIASLLVVASACQKKQDNAAIGIYDEGVNSPVAIEFSTNVRTSQTKAPIDAWNGEELYVFGYERIPYTASQPLSLSNAFIDTVPAQAPASGTEGGINVCDTDGHPFYYGYKNNAYIAYDFYACYISDAAALADIQKAETTISVPFEINGTQDLMIAAANREADTWSEATQTSIVEVEKAYSGYSARRGVTPDLKFRHCLTRFDFSVKNCSTTGTVINIDDFTISSVTTGKLVVADIAGGVTGVVADADAQVNKLPVALPDGGIELLPGGPEQTVGSMMVIPADVHTIDIGFKQLIDASVPDEYKENLSVSYDIQPQNVTIDENTTATEFKVGFKYNVLVKIYGLEKIEINVSLEPWSEGGNITIDPDELPW